jgi:L-amino acid N-acyltransferase YncA
VIIREASAADLPAITEIYNDVIDTSDAIWLDEHVTLADRMAWFEHQGFTGQPVLVAVSDDGTDDGTIEGDLLGYASFGEFRAKAGYWPTVEHTIHIRADHRGAGIGQALLDALVERAEAMGKHVMIAGVDAGNAGSIRFHERNGFRLVASMPGVGRKNGRPVDLILMQRELTPSDGPA